jgi:hypothetical protein
LSQLPMEVLDKMMTTVRKGNVGSTAHQQKVELEKAKGDNRILVEQEKTRRAQEVSRHSAAARIQAAQIAKAGKESTRSTLDQLAKEKADGTITPYREAVYNALREDVLSKAFASESNKPDQLDLPTTLKSGQPTVKPKTTPAPAKMPETPEKTDTPDPKPAGAAKPKMSEQEALKMVQSKRGTPDYEKFKKYFKDAYGKEPNV